MTDGSFVDAIKEAVQGPQVVDGKTYKPTDWQLVPRSTPPVPEPLQLMTLSGISSYIRTNVDGLDRAKIILNVASQNEVRVYSDLVRPAPGEEYARCEFARAVAHLPAFPFGTFMDAESFSIALRTQFIPSIEREELLSLIASIRDSSVTETNDDGVSQEVKTARGIALVDRTKVPVTVHLRPYRTFREVEQPASEFVLRLRSATPESNRPKIALFEADGGQWKVLAIKAIEEWLAVENLGVSIVA